MTLRLYRLISCLASRVALFFVRQPILSHPHSALPKQQNVNKKPRPLVCEKLLDKVNCQQTRSLRGKWGAPYSEWLALPETVRVARQLLECSKLDLLCFRVGVLL